MTSVKATTQVQKSTSGKTEPTEKEIRTIRHAIDEGAEPGEIDEKKLPAAVKKYQAAIQKKDDPEGISISQLDVGKKSYFMVDVDENSGNGYVDILSADGQLVTGYGYTESGDGPSYYSSPAEAKLEREISDAATKTFKPHDLGTAKLKSLEVPMTKLPKTFKDVVARAKDNDNEVHYYKLAVGARTYYGEYTKFAADNGNIDRELGDVTLYDENARFIGNEMIPVKVPTSLKFNVGIDHPSDLL